MASSFVLTGCYDSILPDAGEPDGGVVDRDDAGAGCSCRSGTFHVEGEGLGARTDQILEVRDCAGDILCTVDGEPRRCYEALSVTSLHVHRDEAGYIQLIFHRWGCHDEWTGNLASEAGGYPITATRQR